MDIKDYLPLYLGCEVMIEGQYKCKLTGWERKYPVVENLGFPSWARFQTVKILDFELIKPLLRPLSDMTEEELKDVSRTMLEFSNLSFKPEAHELMSKSGQTFYYDNYDDEGNYISCSISNISNLPLKCIPLLLSKHFDLFGLIPAGLAIDKTNQP